jgi:hypothetical protein
MCKRRLGVQLLQNPPLCSSTVHKRQFMRTLGKQAFFLSLEFAPNIEAKPLPATLREERLRDGERERANCRCVSWRGDGDLSPLQ